MSVWDELVGQQPAIDLLSAAAAASTSGSGGGEASSAMTHAWLITGPPGSGRSVAARAFAAALLCPDGGCGHCHECTTVAAGTHADVTVVATDKVTIAIDEVRELVSIAQRAPSGGRWRVIVIEDADRMTERTSNVLLKAIEEPPERTVWLLCAPSPGDVIVTIRSRCRPVRLRIPPVREVAALLTRRDGIEPELALQCARAVQSHIGMARRLAKDADARKRRHQVLTTAGKPHSVGQAVLAAGELVDLVSQDAKALAAEREERDRAELLRSLGAQEQTTLPPAIRAQLRQFDQDAKRRATRASRDSVDRALVDLLSLYRDVYSLQMAAPVELINADMRPLVEKIAFDSTPRQTTRRLEAIATARTRLAGNVTPLLAMEALMVALAGA